MLLGSLLAGTEISLVVEVHAVGDGIKALRRTEFFHYNKQFVFAMKATGGVVPYVCWAIDFVGQNDFKWNSLFHGKSGRICKLGASQAW